MLLKTQLNISPLFFLLVCPSCSLSACLFSCVFCFSFPDELFSDRLRMAKSKKKPFQLSIPLPSLFLLNITFFFFFPSLHPCCSFQECLETDSAAVCSAVLQYPFTIAVWTTSSTRVEHCRSECCAPWPGDSRSRAVGLFECMCRVRPSAADTQTPLLSAIKNGLAFQQLPSLLFCGSSL